MAFWVTYSGRHEIGPGTKVAGPYFTLTTVVAEQNRLVAQLAEDEQSAIEQGLDRAYRVRWQAIVYGIYSDEP